MFFQRIYDEGLAQASYLIGCQMSGEALVVDPHRDIQVYLQEAERQNLRIVAVTETHIHADYLSGARELAVTTGATLYLSAEGGEDWGYAFEHKGLRHGDVLTLGNLAIKVLHTPGHTPEHLSFLVTDGARAAAEPALMLSGDFVFVGDLGRPDLLDTVAGSKDSRFVSAKQLFASLRDTFLTLPDHLQVWPGHGAGSACGKALGAVPSTTVGYERRFAWWSIHVGNGDEAGFVASLLEGQPDAPSYFGRMKLDNRDGPTLRGNRSQLRHLSPQNLAQALRDGALLVDTRELRAYASGAVPGSLHLPAGKNFTSWAAWLIDPQTNPRPLVLFTQDAGQAQALSDQLARVGIDEVVGYVSGLDGLPQKPQPQFPIEGLELLPNPFFLDVRTANEYAAGHLPNATHLHAGRLPQRLDDLPRQGSLVVYCQSGNRSAAAASLLRASGFDNVFDLVGGYQAWSASARPAAPASPRAAPTSTPLANP